MPIIKIPQEIYDRLTERKKRYGVTELYEVIQILLDQTELEVVREQAENEIEAIKEQASDKARNSINKSTAVKEGHLFEAVVRHFKGYPYRFDETFWVISSFSSPVDFIVFQGLAEKNIRQITLLDAQLPKYISGNSKKQVKKCVEAGFIDFGLIRPMDIGLEM